VTEEGFEDCSGFTSTGGEAGPVKITMKEAKILPERGILMPLLGYHYFACGVPGHCGSHQKLKVKVNSHCGREKLSS